MVGQSHAILLVETELQEVLYKRRPSRQNAVWEGSPVQAAPRGAGWVGALVGRWLPGSPLGKKNEPSEPPGPLSVGVFFPRVDTGFNIHGGTQRTQNSLNFVGRGVCCAGRPVVKPEMAGWGGAGGGLGTPPVGQTQWDPDTHLRCLVNCFPMRRPRQLSGEIGDFSTNDAGRMRRSNAKT